MESIIELDNNLRAIFDASNDAMSIVDSRSGKFIAINDSHSRVFGYSLDALNTISLGKFYQYNSANSTATAVKQFQQAAAYENFPIKITAHNGAIIEIILSCTSIDLFGAEYLLLVNKPIAETGSKIKYSGMISIEDAFNDAEAKWKSITENSADHIMLIDTKGTILYINHTVPGLSIEQVLGKSCYDFVKPTQVSILKACYQRVIQTGQPDRFEIDYEVDSDTLYLENHVGPVLREGKVIALTIATRDVTEWRKTLKALEKSQQHLKHAMQAGHTGTWEWNILTNEVIWSDGVEEMFGMAPGSFQGSYEAFRTFIHPDDADILEQAIAQTLKHDAPYYVEHRCIYPDGSLHWLSGQGKVYRDEDGTPRRMIGTVTEITQRKEAEQALRQSEFLLAKSQEITHIGSYSWDLASNIYTWSEEMYRIFDLPKEAFDGSAETIIETSVHPNDRDKLYQAQMKVITEKKPQPMEFRLLLEDGSIRHVYANAFLSLDDKGDVKTMIGTVQDITERKLAEAALHESQQKLALHFQQTPLGVIDWNTDFQVTEWNPAAEKIFGYSRAEALERTPLGFIVPETIKPTIDEIWHSLINNTGGKRSTNENLTKDGNVIVCEWYNTPLVNEAGNVIGVSSLVQDVTERAMAQRELEKHRKNLEELVTERTEEIREQARIIDQIHDSVVSTDLDGIITSWNHGAERMFGYSAKEAVGKNVSFVYPEDQHEFLLNEIITPLKENGEHEVEVIMQRRSRERFYALLSLSVWQDEQGNATGLIGYSIDITDRKKAESQILQQQKALEAANKELEAFSYSVSHDLRSPLRAIDGFSSAIFEDYNELLDEEGKANLQRIRKNAQRMAALIDDLLQLSRVTRQQLHKEPISLSLLAQDVIQKYKYENPERIVDIKIDDEMNVEGDAGLLRIALDNLISNAWKYTARNESARIVLHKVKKNGSPTFCIEDNGVGFDMRYVDKLFGAFQRLHSPEEFSGNGIGLATVARIITRHGGTIWAEGAPDNGAKFYFTLESVD